MKFFSFNDLREGVSVQVSSNPLLIDHIFSGDKLKSWRSVGGTQGEKEEIHLIFSRPLRANCLLLLGHNWRAYEVFFKEQGAWTTLSPVLKLNEERGGSRETHYTHPASYLQFSSREVTEIKMEITHTQGEDPEKYLTQLILTEELGSFLGFPQINGRFENNLVRFKMINQKYKVYKGREVWGADVVFRDYPREYAADIELVYQLMARDSFWIWPCGGRVGADYFSHPLRTFRLLDFFKVQIDQDVTEVFSKNIYSSNLNLNLSLVEVV